MLENIDLPPGCRLTFGGEAAEQAEAIGNLVSTIGVLAVLTVATLVLSPGSFKLAGLIGGVAVAAFGLGLFSVAIFGYPFGFNSIIGTVGLIGFDSNDDNSGVVAALNRKNLSILARCDATLSCTATYNECGLIPSAA